MATVLAQVPLHCECVLAALPALPHEQRRRLQELGFREGISLTITQKTAGGGRIVSIGNTRYAIDGVTAKALSAEQGPAPAKASKASTASTASTASAPKTTATTSAPTNTTASQTTARPEAGAAAHSAAPAAADPANESAAKGHTCHCCSPASSEEHDR